MSERLIPVWLYRIGNDEETHYHGSMADIPGGLNVTVLGVAFREPYKTINGDTDRDGFETAVEAQAERVEWFDTEVET